MKILIEELIDDYLNHGKARMEQKMRTIMDKNVTSEQVLRLSHPVKESVKLFLEKEAGLTAELNRCTTRAEIEQLAHNAFGKIRGIGESAIQNWVSHKAYLLDVENESNCSALLPQKIVIQIASQNYSLQQFREMVINFHDKFKSFKNKDVDSFLLFVEQKRKMKAFVRSIYIGKSE